MKTHASFPAGSFLLSGILTWKECSWHSGQAEQSLPGVHLTRQPFAVQGLKGSAVKGAGWPEQEECCVRVVPEVQGCSARALLNSADRSCLSSHSSACPGPCPCPSEPPASRLFSNPCLPPSPASPRAGGAKLAQSRQTAGRGCGRWKRHEFKRKAFGNAQCHHNKAASAT